MQCVLNDIEQAAITLRSIIIESPKEFDSNKSDIEFCEKEIRDIEHVLELTLFNASNGYKYARDIQSVRIKRRDLKDKNELLDPLVQLVRKMKSYEHEINKVIGEIRRIKQKHEVRQYKMRVREDLQEMIKKNDRGVDRVLPD